MATQCACFQRTRTPRLVFKGCVSVSYVQPLQRPDLYRTSTKVENANYGNAGLLLLAAGGGVRA
jgi:hypothetical protein